MYRTTLWALVLGLTVGCARRPDPPPVPPPPAPAPAPVTFPYTEVWTARPDVPIRVDSGSVAFGSAPRLFTRLEVLGADSSGLRVRCTACAGTDTGWVTLADVVFGHGAPEVAARGELAEFALAVRESAAARDLAALWPVMEPEFTYAFIGPQGRDQALAAWRAEGYRFLEHVPELLDRGLATRDGRIWVAPPDYLERRAYHGLRLGFRRGPEGRWEWLFLVRGEREP